MIRPVAAAIAFVTLLPLAALAQQSSSSPASGTGTTVQEPLIVVEDREFRLRGFAAAVPASRTAEAQFAERRTTFFRKRAQARAVCRDDIRRANKTTLLKTLLRCYMAELTLTREYLARQKELLTALAGLSSPVRSSAIDRVDLSLDAVDTLVFAINSGVYETREDLLEAKTNFHAKYEVPLAEAWLTVRADRALTWTAQLIAEIDALQTQERAAGLDRRELTAGRACLAHQESFLRSLLLAGAKDRSMTLLATLGALRECLKSLQSIPRALTGSGTVISPQ